jgi:hypothetical protein
VTIGVEIRRQLSIPIWGTNDISDCGLRIADWEFNRPINPQSAIPNPQFEPAE